MRLAAVLVVALLAGCAALPSLEGRTTSTVIAPEPGTPLYDYLAADVAAHPGRSAVYSLRDGESAFAARIALIDAAARSLDVQYYIWRDDLTGRLLLDALRRAAERGVRVRLLLDDNGIAGLDPLLAALDAQPNVEVRLFNPFRHRTWRVLGYLTDFRRLNRRMHNKSLTADGVVTIVGGRNIGDEYYGADGELAFVDLDVLTAGAIVAAVGRSFDEYWASDSAYPADRVLPAATPAALARLAGLRAEVDALPGAERFERAIRESPLMTQVAARTVDTEWAQARLVVDDPAKALGRAKRRDRLLARLEDAFDGQPERNLDIVSAYFVPGRGGMKTFVGYAKRGVRVRILTNGLEATDVAAVHAGYAKRRHALLRAGIELYEMKREGETPPSRMFFGLRSAAAAKTGSASRASAAKSEGGSIGESGAAPMGGSKIIGGSRAVGGSKRASVASLHAKTFAVDSQRLFVGSFNFDLRSARLNTEMGIVIDSPRLAQQLADAFDTSIPEVAYQVRIGERGTLEWIERRGDATVVLHDEPHASLLKRFAIGLLSILPIDWLL